MKINKIYKLVKDELMYSGLLTAIGAMSIVLLTLTFLKIKPDLLFLAIAFLGAEIIYSYNRYKEYKKNNLWRTDYLKHRIKSTPLVILLYVFLAFGLLAYLEKIYALFFSLFLILLGVLYSIYLKKVTKKIIGFKNIFVSFCWANIVVFSALVASHPVDLSVILIFFFVYFNTFVHEIILDVRDTEEDQKEKLLTLPILFNKKKLGITIFILSIIAYLLIIIGVYLTVFPAISLVLALTILYNIYIFKKINEICNWGVKYLEIFIDMGKILWFIQIFIFINLL